LKNNIFNILLVSLGLFNIHIKPEKQQIKKEKHIIVLACSYNNKKWYKKHLDSFFMQDYSNAHMIYIDDVSPDGTGNLVEQYINEKGFENRVTLIKNEQRIGALANQYNAIHASKDDDIIVILDGDDWFAHEHVLSYINEVYSDPNIWITYGQFREYPSGKIHGFNRPLTNEALTENKIREFGFIPSHLRTYYAKLYKMIRKEDLIQNGRFFDVNADFATMIPMLEMARKGHIKFINEVLLIYNNANPLNDHRIAGGLQRTLNRKIRKMEKYEAIDCLFAE